MFLLDPINYNTLQSTSMLVHIKKLKYFFHEMTLFWNNSKSHSKYDVFFKMHFYFMRPLFAARLEMACKWQVEKKDCCKPANFFDAIALSMYQRLLGTYNIYTYMLKSKKSVRLLTF